MQNLQSFIYRAKQIVEHYNKPKIEANGGIAPEDAVTIEKDGMVIWNIFIDTTGRFEVNPVEEYGIIGLLNFLTDYSEKIKQYM